MERKKTLYKKTININVNANLAETQTKLVELNNLLEKANSIIEELAETGLKVELKIE